jgi:hypothetical protein
MTKGSAVSGGLQLFSTDPASEGGFAPVQIEHVRDHAFVKRAQAGCGEVIDDRPCKRAKTHPLHHGTPPSMNVLGSGNQFLYQAIRKSWMPLFDRLFDEADLPRGLGRVLVEAEVTFPTRGRRDQGNFRGPLEKVIGDTLKEGGWLADDQWYPAPLYEFGNLTAIYEKDVARVRLTIFPLPVA